MIKHTLGSWKSFRISEQAEGKRPLSIVDSRGRSVACIKGTALLQADPEANALLIAAAPELLDALEGMMVWAVDSVGGDERSDKLPRGYDQWKSVIAKAKGENANDNR